MVKRGAWESFFSRHSRIGIDTNVFIYCVEDHARYGGACSSLLARIAEGRVEAVTATVTFLEMMVAPYRRGDEALAAKVYALLSTHPGILWGELTLEIANRAAALRARHRLGTADAIQLATALSLGATGFIGNDRALRRATEIETLLLDEVV